MAAAAGIQAGFGELLGPDTLGQIREQGFTIVRISSDVPNTLRSHDDATITALAQEVIDAGLQPLVTVRRPDALRALPSGSLAEFGNEPDLKEHFGWPTFESYWRPCEQAIQIALELDLRLYIGVVSNFNRRGFKFLSQMPWKKIDPRICCSIHRYPDTGKGPTAAHDGCGSRAEEVRQLRAIVGNRPVAVTETGYHAGRQGGYSEQEASEHLAWERQFFNKEGFDFVVAYQVNDGAAGDTDKEANFGLRRRDGTWKPAALSFTRAC